MTKSASLPCDAMNLFATRDAGNQGVKLPLVDPVTGKDTEHWIQVRSIDSDAFHRAQTKAMRQISTIFAIEDEDEQEAARAENTLDIIAALVVGWSFEAPCTPENVRAFLRSAPQIRAAINHMAADRSVFIKSSSQTSPDGSAQTDS